MELSRIPLSVIIAERTEKSKKKAKRGRTQDQHPTLATRDSEKQVAGIEPA
jgi:hypothetical protein